MTREQSSVGTSWRGGSLSNEGPGERERRWGRQMGETGVADWAGRLASCAMSRLS